MSFAIKAQERTDAGEWATIPDFGTFTEEYPTVFDAIKWAFVNMEPPVDGMLHFRWAVVDTETGKHVCTV